jgi:hypothetical protein
MGRADTDEYRRVGAASFSLRQSCWLNSFPVKSSILIWLPTAFSIVK